MRRRRAKKRKNDYFTQVHEDAIVAYVATEDKKIRTELYIKFIAPAFNELVDKIVYTYKFNSLPNIEFLKEECKIWLTTILNKYDQSKGSKAFSYFSVITKNWFIHKVKKNTKKMKKELQYDNIPGEIATKYLSTENNYLRDREKEEFWSFLQKEMQSWRTLKLKDNEKKVLDAIEILFENADDIEIFNKKAVYLYLREITGLNTKQVVNNLNKMRTKYKQFRKNWNEGKLK